MSSEIIIICDGIYVDPDRVKTSQSTFFHSGHPVNVNYQQKLYIKSKLQVKFQARITLSQMGLKLKTVQISVFARNRKDLSLMQKKEDQLSAKSDLLGVALNHILLTCATVPFTAVFVATYVELDPLYIWMKYIPSSVNQLIDSYPWTYVILPCPFQLYVVSQLV
ncbi:hypothetical protein Fcan01_26850 [Folsomia candida]|uniref:Uncharacterized protein n=1 Tax=Folsomia candida TaxID=158441 RepID=A0A226D116_FOLCA|nr:hypothetical protein Fcan01_26850 [Folsomia candida]